MQVFSRFLFYHISVLVSFKAISTPSSKMTRVEIGTSICTENSLQIYVEIFCFNQFRLCVQSNQYPSPEEFCNWNR